MNKTILLFAFMSALHFESPPIIKPPEKDILSEAEMVEVDDGDKNEHTRKYRYNFKHLCPTTPPPAVVECQNKINSARQVTQMFAVDDVPADALKKIFDLQQCQETHVPNVQASISIFCYLDGTLLFAEEVIKKDVANYETLKQQFITEL